MEPLKKKGKKKKRTIPTNPEEEEISGKIHKSKDISQIGEGNFLYPVMKHIEKFKNTEERHKAKKLYKVLKKSNLKWNAKGEILYKYKPVRGSNIIVLIKHALRSNNSKPHGYKYFYKALQHMYIPPDIVKNSLGKGVTEKRNSFRPPGKLVNTISTKTL